jgi:Family of unknown function (DUF6152)
VNCMGTKLVGLGSALVVGVGLLTAGPVYAHHAFAAEFDASKPIILQGTITKIEWVNPHGWIYVDVKSADGTIVNWAVETSTSALIRRGLRKTDLPFGSELEIRGYQARDDKPVATGYSLKLKDGRGFILGSENTGTSLAPPQPGGREQ